MAPVGTKGKVRAPAVAGMFYPSDPDELRRMVAGFLVDTIPTGVESSLDSSSSPRRERVGRGLRRGETPQNEPPLPNPLLHPHGGEGDGTGFRFPAATTVGPTHSFKAFILPHAGYVYSGPVAGTGYRLLHSQRDTIRRVVLLGPSHRMAFCGLALSGHSAFATPLGTVPVDQAAIGALRKLPQVVELDAAHQYEHSLEVHLPFLQVILGDFSLVPLVVGDALETEVAEVIDCLWGGEETCFVISTDLSHFHDYSDACTRDAETARRIEALQPVTLDQACGAIPLNGLLHTARTIGMKVRQLDLRNSGDTAGSRDRVVGYGAFATR